MPVCERCQCRVGGCLGMPVCVRGVSVFDVSVWGGWMSGYASMCESCQCGVGGCLGVGLQCVLSICVSVGWVNVWEWVCQCVWSVDVSVWGGWMSGYASVCV